MSETCTIFDALRMANSAVDSYCGIIRYFGKAPNYNDEPKIHEFRADLCDSSVFSDVKTNNPATGASVDPLNAQIKALGEAFERYGMSIYRKSRLVRARYEDLENAVNPQSFVTFSKKQLLEHDMEICLPNDSPFYWSKGRSLSDGNEVYLPSQLIYVPYDFGSEQVLRMPISTGAAAGTSLNSALKRAICEMIERECFIITWLNKISPSRILIDVELNEPIEKFLRELERYNIIPYLFDISLDVSTFTVLCTLIDKSGYGPAISMGMKTSPDPMKSMIGALEEAEQARLWVRDLIHGARKSFNDLFSRQHSISSLEERVLLWSYPEMLEHLNFLLSSEKTISLSHMLSKALSDDLHSITTAVCEKNLNVYWVDITPTDVFQLGFKVVKAISPDFHPFHLDENYRYLGGKRLYDLPVRLGLVSNPKSEHDLYQIAHPFS